VQSQELAEHVLGGVVKGIRQKRGDHEEPSGHPPARRARPGDRLREQAVHASGDRAAAEGQEGARALSGRRSHETLGSEDRLRHDEAVAKAASGLLVARLFRGHLQLGQDRAANRGKMRPGENLCGESPQPVSAPRVRSLVLDDCVEVRGRERIGQSPRDEDLATSQARSE